MTAVDDPPGEWAEPPDPGYDDLGDRIERGELEALDTNLPAPSAYKLNGNGTHPPTDTADDDRTSWWPTDLTGLFDGSAVLPEPTIGPRSDGQPLVYPGKVHAFNGESESGKSWCALLIGVAEINAGHHVHYLDFEDDANTVVTRLLALGAKPEAVLAYFHYASPGEPLTYKGIPQASSNDLTAALELWPPSLAILDGVTEAMTLHGLDLNSNQDYATFHRLLPKRLTLAGAAAIDIDHVTKNIETRNRYAIGAQHKLAGMDGAVFTFDVARPFGLGLHGVARLTIQKDRPGQLRRHAKGKGVIAEFHMDSDPDTHALKAYIDPPPSDAELEDAKDRRLMTAVSHWLAMHPGEHSRTEIDNAITGRRADVLEAIDQLVPKYVTSRKEGKATYHGHVELYREDEP